MAARKHLELSDFIKSVHQNLRKTSDEMGAEEAWQKHCSDTENLKKYAQSMKELACQHWERDSESSSNNSRIHWTIKTSADYFTKDIYKFRDREKDISTKINLIFTLPHSYGLEYVNKLKLLDVGSCYNPFDKFGLFDVTAIDIAPAIDEVLKCDFLSIKIGNEVNVNDKELCELPKSYFDIVVFSLLLEYLPSPKQRLICCERAYNLLKNEGLLIVITPDSNHVGINAKYMKSWRYVLAKMGFSRIKYEKLTHVHCMAFRKAISKEVANRWAELHKDHKLFEEIYIPQDFNKSSEQMKRPCNSEKNTCSIDFNELPNIGDFK